VKWKFAFALGALSGGLVWLARRRRQKAAEDAALWAEATDPVARFGET
jgi:hypothetical protein